MLVNSKKIKEIIDEKEQLNPPSWLEFQPEQFTFAVVREPNRDDIDYQVEESLIVEFHPPNLRCRYARY